MYEDAGRKGEREKVGHRICRGKVQRRILLVRGEVEPIAAIEDTANIVHLTKAVIRVILVHREIGEVPCLCNAVRNSHKEMKGEIGTHVGVIHNRCDDPEEHDKAKKDVDLRPPREHEGAADPGYLRPVERKDGHSHSGTDAK